MARIYKISAPYENNDIIISFTYLPYRGALQPAEAELNDIEFECDDAEAFDKAWMWADWWVEQHQDECLSVVMEAS